MVVCLILCGTVSVRLCDEYHLKGSRSTSACRGQEADDNWDEWRHKRSESPRSWWQGSWLVKADDLWVTRGVLVQPLIGPYRWWALFSILEIKIDKPPHSFFWTASFLVSNAWLLRIRGHEHGHMAMYLMLFFIAMLSQGCKIGKEFWCFCHKREYWKNMCCKRMNHLI